MKKQHIILLLCLYNITNSTKETLQSNQINIHPSPRSVLFNNNTDNTENLNEALDETAIGTAAGSLNTNFDNASDVITLGGMAHPYNKLITNCGIEISFTGKERIEGMFGVNTKYLNNANIDIDSYSVPGKSTTDIGIMAAAGKHTGHDKDVITLGIDLRSRATWGKPQEVGKTTTASLSYAGIPYGSHNHTIGIPLLYVRGVDLTLDLNELICNIPSEYPIQKLKLGFFPIEIGRGISLGAAYAVSPDVLSYAPADVIQEFAPGFMLYGSLNEKKSLDYRLYLGIIKNLSGSHSDIMEKTRINQYNMEFFPHRGSGVFNIVSALQVDWKCTLDNDKKVALSPYIVIAHEGAGKVVLPEDSVNNLVTYGFEFSAEQNNDWKIDFEFAKNIGSQSVLGIDTNTFVMEQRSCSVEGEYGLNNNTTIGIISNSAVTFQGYTDIINNDSISSTTDIVNKNATFLGETSSRQKAINNVYKNSSSNGTIIDLSSNGYTLKNSDSRFRDPYVNIFTGNMAVLDISKNIIILKQPIKLAFAIGYASGDDNPNRPLLEKNDHITNGDFKGFIGIQELYSGQMVRSAFLMRGAGKMPRIASVPAVILNNDNMVIDTIDYPSTISGFNNLLYSGASVNFIYDGCSYKWKWHPNILFYGQPDARTIYNQKIINTLNKNTLDPFLGTELNCFLEIISKQFDGFKIFSVCSIFIPGEYYKDLSQIPLDKAQDNYMNTINAGEKSTFIPLINTNVAYYFNLGLEFKF